MASHVFYNAFASAKSSNFRASEAIQCCERSKSSAATPTKEQRKPLGYTRANPWLVTKAKCHSPNS
eukprot:5931978-Lingulodinium_polyedra.AAC.1